MNKQIISRSYNIHLCQQFIFQLVFSYLCITAKLQYIQIRDKLQTSKDRKMNIDESSQLQNKLDIAFIAEDSREVRSQSMSHSCSNSMASEVQSISAISGLALNFSYERSISSPSISGMEQWPNQTHNIFGTMRRQTRSSAKAINNRSEQSNIEEEDLQQQSNNEGNQKLGQRCKKRLCQKMKVITISETRNNKPQTQSSTKNGYNTRLRSNKQKSYNAHNAHFNNDSSSEDLREIVAQLGSSKKEQREIYSIRGAKK